MLREAPRAISEWVAHASLPEITLAEIERRPTLHAIPVTGWRRLTGLAASLLAGITIVLVAGWTLWQGVGFVDETIGNMVGSGDDAPPPTEAPATVTVAVGQGPVATQPVANSGPALAWQTHGMTDGLPPGDVTALALAPDGSVWAALRASTQVRAAVYVDESWHRASSGLEEVAGVPSWVAVDGLGYVWMAVTTEDAGDRLVGFDGSTWVDAQTPAIWGSVVAEGGGGEIWVAGLDRGMRPTLLEWAEGKWVATHAPSAIDVAGAAEPGEMASGALVGRVVVDREGTAWFAGDGAVARFDGRTLTLSEMGASWLALDAGGGVWAPTPRGLRRHAGSSWAYFDARHGLPGTAPVAGSVRFGTDHVYAAFAGSVGTVAHSASTGSWEPVSDVPPGSGLAFVPVYAPRLAYTPATAARTDEPMWLLADGTWSIVHGPTGHPVTGVHDVCRAPDGTFWIAAGLDLRSFRIGEP